MFRFKFFSVIILVAALFVSCVKEKPVVVDDSGFAHGAFITNEGAFGNSNGSISYFDTDSAILSNYVFESVNGRPLGDVVQSISFGGDKAFIVVNNSQKVEVVDLKTFNSIGTISGLEYPRYFLAVNKNKGYLTDGNFSGRIYVIDLNALTITDTIPCGNGPEKMILHNQTLIVANSGGWGNDSTLTLVDTQTDAVSATWIVGHNPTDLAIDANDQLWVLCKGKVVWNPDFSIGEETMSSLTVLNPVSGAIKHVHPIGVVGDYFWPQRLGLNKSKTNVVFLEAEGLHTLNVNAFEELSKLLIPETLYGFGIDPDTDIIYALQVPSFTTSGWMLRFKADGTAIDSLEVGIGPSQVVFN
jgi:hypothetical protein